MPRLQPFVKLLCSDDAAAPDGFADQGWVHKKRIWYRLSEAQRVCACVSLCWFASNLIFGCMAHHKLIIFL